ncbi:hypothetical protein GPECTOR_64g105 [Gonium pectorale]|uniref:Ricin B lectin domain-containing protein n=1 Tax=Gonium pectorale TaxID=33097 RepID=A0A150G464_GONPE|nr:hypothetical protein GPECTOR_64g105 [Gonium pectorale]|eukprot:KXZ44611.1 hypothetical protein GPECTOR_64g105 [Gonium pectorale]
MLTQISPNRSSTNAYQIKSEAGFCVTVQNGGTNSGTRIILDNCVNGATNQLWKASAGFNAGVSLSPYHALNLCLDNAGGSGGAGLVNGQASGWCEMGVVRRG